MNPFGANYRTSTSGLIETGCLIVIGLAIFPPEMWTNPRLWIPAAGLVVAKTVKDFVTKDRAVTGGSVQQTLGGSVASEGVQNLVDQTLVATKASGESVTPEQQHVFDRLNK